MGRSEMFAAKQGHLHDAETRKRRPRARASFEMSTVEIDGFLSCGLQHHVDECRRRHAAWFELVARTNRLGQSLLGEVRIDPSNFQQWFAGLFFGRLLGHVQGAVLLIERGMLAPGEVLCRAGLEALFGLLAVIERLETAQDLIRADPRQQRRLLNATLRRGDSLGAHALQEAASVLDEVRQSLNQNPSPEITTRCLAEWGRVGDLYDSAYAILSLSVHANLRDLERQLELDHAGNPRCIRWGPTLDGVDESLLLLVDIVVRAATGMCELFKLGHDGELKEIRGSYAALAAGILERMPNNSVEPTP